jgi:capsular polysaccharide biosynthesis protein
MQNEHEVEAVLARLGFAIVRPQDHSFDEQVTMFSRARVVVGPHGAGLTNAAFAPQGCLVIDIFPDSWSTSWVFRLTQRFKHFYLPVVYASDPELSRPLLLGDVEISRSHVYRVPVNEFASVVAEVMHAIGPFFGVPAAIGLSD